MDRVERAKEISGDVSPSWRLDSYWKAGWMGLRGLPYKLLMGESHLLLVGSHVSLRNPRHIYSKGTLVIEDYAEVQGLSKHGIIFGHHVTIGRFAQIRPSGYYGREIGEGLIVGNNSNVGPYCYIGCSGLVTIGDNVLMGPRVSMIAENHNIEDMDRPIRQQGVTRQPITIENDCWLGSSSVILAGTHIGKGAVVAAGAVVIQDVEPNTIVGGVPARLIKRRGCG